MSDRKAAALLLIGSELTRGIIRDTHGSYIASRLTSLGLDVKKILLIPDDEAISEELRGLVGVYDLVIITGGLGPTSDDITRSAVAQAAGVRLVFQDYLWEDIKARFSVSGRNSNKDQAFIPEGFEPVINEKGTAPGFKGYIGKTLLFSLPGPPGEMEFMLERDVLHSISEEMELTEEEILEVSCFLICESGLEDACRSSGLTGVSWGTRAQENRISLYIKGGTEDKRLALLDYLKEYFGDERIRVGNVDIVLSLYNLLKERKLTVSAAESFTGGLFSKLLTDIPGSSEVFAGGVVSYTNSFKIGFLGLEREVLEKNGAVSGRTACDMALGVQKKSGSDYGISFTGFAGPGGGVEEAPVGTVFIGLKAPGMESRQFPFNFTGSRSRIRKKSVLAGFLLLEMSAVDSKRLDRYLKWQYS